MLSGGKLGFFAFTVSPTVYANLSSTPFVKTANPSLTPAIPTSTTGIEQTTIWYRFTLKIELYMLLHNM